MSLQYDSLHAGIVAALDSQNELNKAIERYAAVVNTQLDLQDRLIRELRDDLHAVANRVETLTRSAFACTPDESGGIRDDG